MLFKPLVAAGLESLLNHFLYRPAALWPARQRLQGKTLRLVLKAFPSPLTLIFNERQVDVTGEWEGATDSTVITSVGVLPRLRDRQQLTTLIRSGELEVQGDLQVAQNFVALADLAQFDPAEWLAPYIGDIAAEGAGRVLHGGAKRVCGSLARQRHYLRDALTEEWRLAPGPLEAAWFTKETRALTQAVEILAQRLERLEGK